MAKAKRKSLSKRVRFEVFKRDSFTCQYCGRKSPDVVLQVDHIIPVAKGGTDDIMNLVTSCVDCNQGKTDRSLSDNSVVEMRRRQVELQQERLEQISMMSEWQLSLIAARKAELAEVNRMYEILTDGERCIKDSYLNSTVSKLIDRYGLDAVLDALREGTRGYGGNARKALEKLGGICANRANPEINMKSMLLIRIKRRFPGKPWNKVASLLDRGRKAMGMAFLEEMKDWLDEDLGDYGNEDWNEFCDNLASFVSIAER